MVYYNRPTRLAPDTEERIFKELHRQMPEGFRVDGKSDKGPPPLEPEASRRAIQTKPDLQVELVASEPLVQSPVAIDWGPDGKLWVVEMFDYPTGVDGNFRPGGRVKYLIDQNGDGRYDRAVTLADDLPFPTGVMAWRKGVLVCAAPDVLYLEDRDGDGKADVRQVILTGFDVSNFQARINGLSEGLDGWIYAANGLLGGRISSPLNRRKPIDLGGRDLRFRPDSGEVEPASGLTQQGRVRDDWGEWFGNDNSNLLWHYPLKEHYLNRNPRFLPPLARVPITLGDPDPNRLFPISRMMERFNDPHHAGRVTSACGPTIYRDDWLGEEFAGNAFICEPVHNLVTRRILSRKGLTLTGRRADDERSREFLASSDGWFRPVQVRTGPDGALWIVDMYRVVIEHPRWIPPDRLAKLDVRAGADRGRIYRVISKNRAPRSVPNIAARPIDEVVGLLESRNGVVRDLAQRRLLHEAPRATSALRGLVRQGNPFGRLHALCVLAATRQLDRATLQVALNDSQPEIRIWALRSAESLVSQHPEIERELFRLENDSDLRVRCQLAYTLGSCHSPDAADVLARLASRDGEDPYFRAAVLSSVRSDSLSNFSESLLRLAELHPPARSLLPVVAAMVPALADSETAVSFLTAFARGQWDRTLELETFAAWIDAMERERKPFSEPLQSLMKSIGHKADAILRSETSSVELQVRAVRLLGRSPEGLEADITLLAQCLRPQKPPEVQRAALDRLGSIKSPIVPEKILGMWPTLPPTGRQASLDLLLQRDSWVESVVVALETRRILPADLTSSQRVHLCQSSSQAIKHRAEKALQGALARDRDGLIRSYAQQLMKVRGDSRRGEQVFAKSCATCHRLGNLGQAVGPDLAAVTQRDTESWLIAILDPNRALDGRYALLHIVTQDGRQFNGMLVSETASSLVLQAANGQRFELLRREIDEITNTGRSLMPEGLEQEIPPESMADLLAFLQGSRPKAKQVPGNRPEVVKPESDGTIRLRANQSEIYGDTITFESEFENLGWWQGSSDYALWRVEGVRPGRYAVELHFSCDNSSQGNIARIESGTQCLDFHVPGTGGWDRYVVREVGKIALGTHPVVVIRPAPPLRGALFDLKEVRLRLISP
jgi:putative membrane-bound dehydrogenase-like protein